MDNVVWKDIPGYEGLYQVSNVGEIKSLRGWNGRGYVHREKILSKTMTTTGYYKVELTKDGIRKSLKVHRLVAYAFIPRTEGKPYINHKDGNPLNNVVDNLEWCTQKENVNHALNIGLKKQFKISEYELRAMYEGGMSAKDIAQQKQTSRMVIYNNMKKYGINRRTYGEANNKYHINLNELIEEFKEGKTNKELSREYDCPSNLIAVRRYQFRKRGII